MHRSTHLLCTHRHRASQFLRCCSHIRRAHISLHGISLHGTLVIGFLYLRPQAGICQIWSLLVSKLSCLSRAKGGNSFLSHLHPVMGRVQGVTGSLQSSLRELRFIRLVAGVYHLLSPVLTWDPSTSVLQPIPFEAPVGSHPQLDRRISCLVPDFLQGNAFELVSSRRMERRCLFAYRYCGSFFALTRRIQDRQAGATST